MSCGEVSELSLRTIADSFDHLIGATEQRKRYDKAECLSGFQIDDQIDLSDLLNWKISWLLPLENPPSAPGSLEKRTSWSVPRFFRITDRGSVAIVVALMSENFGLVFDLFGVRISGGNDHKDILCWRLCVHGR